MLRIRIHELEDLLRNYAPRTSEILIDNERRLSTSMNGKDTPTRHLLETDKKPAVKDLPARLADKKKMGLLSTGQPFSIEASRKDEVLPGPDASLILEASDHVVDHRKLPEFDATAGRRLDDIGIKDHLFFIDRLEKSHQTISDRLEKLKAHLELVLNSTDKNDSNLLNSDITNAITELNSLKDLEGKLLPDIENLEIQLRNLHAEYQKYRVNVQDSLIQCKSDGNTLLTDLDQQKVVIQ